MGNGEVKASQVTEGSQAVGKTFTIKAQRHQIFGPGEVYQFDFDNPEGEWELKCECLGYLADKDEYRFKVVEAEKQ